MFAERRKASFRVAIPALAVGLLSHAAAVSADAALPAFGEATPLGEIVEGSGFADISYTDPADIASGGGYLLSVWQERANDGWRLRGRRLTTEGGVIDAVPLEISEGTTIGTYSPAVAYDGTRFLVVWQERAEGTDGAFYQLLARRVSTAGELLDAAPIAVADVDTGGLSPSPTPDVAGVDGVFLVAWTDRRRLLSKADVYASRVDGATGSVDAADGFVVSASDEEKGAVRAASDGYDFLVVWDQREEDGFSDDVDILAAKVGAADGLVSAPITICGVASSRSEAPVVAGHDGVYLVAWADERDTSLADQWTRGTLVDGADLSVATPDGALLASSADERMNPIDVVSAGSDFAILVASPSCPISNYDDLRLLRVDGDGGAPLWISAEPLWGTGSLYGFGLTAVSDDGAFVFASRTSDVHLGLGGRSAPVGGAVDIGTASTADERPRYLNTGVNSAVSITAAAGSAATLLAWSDTRGIADGTGTDIYARRVARDGTALSPLDASPVRVSSGTSDDILPAAASTGGRFLVVWSAAAGMVDGRSCTRAVYGARIDEATGALLDPEPIQLAAAAPGREEPVVAGFGGRFLVAWASPDDDSIYGAMVDAETGAVDDWGGEPLFHTGHGNSLSIAVGADRFWLSWTDRRDAISYSCWLGDWWGMFDVTTNIEVFAGGVDVETGEISDPDGELQIAVGSDSLSSRMIAGTDGLWLSWNQYDTPCAGVADWSAIHLNTAVVSTGSPLVGTATATIVPPWTAYYYLGAAASGAELLSVWYVDDGIWNATRHLGVDGSALDDPPIEVAVSADAPNPYNVTMVGDPGGYALFWAGPSADGRSDQPYGLAVDLPGCVIGGEAYAAGADLAVGGCLRCVPAVDDASWTPLPVGTPCDDGDPSTACEQCWADGVCACSEDEPDAGADADTDADSDADADTDVVDTDTDHGDGGTPLADAGEDGGGGASIAEITASSGGCTCGAVSASAPAKGLASVLALLSP